MIRKIFTTAALTTLIVCALLLNARADITTGLVGYWPLNDGPGSSTVADLSGNNNTGTLTNFADATYNNMWTTTTDPTNMWPQALVFNSGGSVGSTTFGTNTCVSIPDSASIDSMSANKTWTLSCWFNPSVAGASEPNNAGIIAKGNQGAEAFAVYFLNGKLVTIFHNLANSGTETVTNQTTINANTWYHLAVTVWVPRQTGSLAEALIYVNGVVGSLTNANTFTTVLITNLPVTIGCRAGTLANGGIVTNAFLGTIDEVRMYNRALSSNDIVQLYTNRAFSLVNNGIGSWNGLAGSGGTATLDATSLNFCTNLFAAPLGAPDSLTDLLAVEQAGSLASGCSFGDKYYSNSIAYAVQSTNVNIASGGVAIGTAGGPGTSYFQNNALTYFLNSTDGIGLTDGANKTALVQSGSGTTILTGTNTFTGGATVNAGTLMIGNGSTPAAPVLNSNCPVTVNGGTLKFNGNDSPTITNAISGAGSVAWVGAGTLTLGENNTYTGGTLITNGTLSVDSIADAVPSPMGSNVLTLASGTLSYTGAGAAATARQITGIPGTISTINLPAGNLTVTGRVTGTAGFIINKTGTGTLTLANTADNSSLSMNIQAGKVILNTTSATSVHGLGGGTSMVSGATAQLQLSGTGGFDIFSGCAIIVTNGGFIDLNGQSDAMSTLNLSGNGSGSGVLINGSGTASSLACGGSGVVLGANTTIGGSGNITLMSVVSGAGSSLTYAGSGVLTLSNADTYSGTTTIGSGTMALIGGASIANSPNIIVAGGATFSVSGLSSTFTLGAGQTLSNNTSTATINGSANTGSGTVSLTYGAGTPSFNITNGTLTLSPGTVLNVNNTGAALGTGTYTLIGTNATGVVAGTVPLSFVVGGGGVGGTPSLIISSSNTLDLVVAPSVNTNATNIVFSVSGGQLTLSWPADHTGWRLQSQTNDLTVGLYTNWFDVSGSTATNQEIFSINPTNGCVFYRLVYP